jgi:hypothetical protein
VIELTRAADLFVLNLECCISGTRPAGGRPAQAILLPCSSEGRLADGEEADWIRQRFRTTCAALGIELVEEGGGLVVSWR